MISYESILLSASMLCAAFGVGVFVLEATRGQILSFGIPMALDFWLAAGLLKLSATFSWSAVLTAGLIVFVRKLTTFTLSILRHKIGNL